MSEREETMDEKEKGTEEKPVVVETQDPPQAIFKGLVNYGEILEINGKIYIMNHGC